MSRSKKLERVFWCVAVISLLVEVLLVIQTFYLMVCSVLMNPFTYLTLIMVFGFLVFVGCWGMDFAEWTTRLSPSHLRRLEKLYGKDDWTFKLYSFLLRSFKGTV